MYERDAHTETIHRKQSLHSMGAFEEMGALNLQGLMRTSLKAGTLGLALFSLPPALEASHTRPTWLANDTVVQAGDTGGQAGDWRDRVAKRRVVPEQRCKPTGGAPGWGRDGRIALADVAVRGASCETRSL